ncbi:ribosomal protein S18-alanine N-acetyltransferase [uncultured Clostridium sp.]|uniref:ribosomal protein S18-alanine N-acetyltransferase n=1 Tax=uncultured Clostridium sp. TaxID=59620 RepID=UPI00260D9958|nr:ribosomal protein S18-alanine N-acetyltransferase [uncultured Clostridium sp.]
MDNRIYFMDESHIEGVQKISELSIKDYWSITELRKELTNNVAKYLVYIEDNKVVGFIGLWIVCDEGQITNIGVHPDYRKRGIATSLLNATIEYLKTLDCNIITLEVRKSNSNAYDLYSQIGFSDEGVRRKFYKDGEDAIIMWYRYEDFED